MDDAGMLPENAFFKPSPHVNQTLPQEAKRLADLPAAVFLPSPLKVWPVTFHFTSLFLSFCTVIIYSPWAMLQGVLSSRPDVTYRSLGCQVSEWIASSACAFHNFERAYPHTAESPQAGPSIPRAALAEAQGGIRQGANDLGGEFG